MNESLERFTQPTTKLGKRNECEEGMTVTRKSVFCLAPCRSSVLVSQYYRNKEVSRLSVGKFNARFQHNGVYRARDMLRERERDIP
jgi:hypothetical protein